MTVPTVTKWTEASLVLALRTRYPSNEWALVTQVRDGAGWDRRTFDAVAIGLWASRGHPVHGFECKVTRSDWKRELAKPEKADPLVAFCNHWWIVAPKGVVGAMELPIGWGLLEAQENGTIRTVVESPRREDVKPPTMGFVAQLVKRVLVSRPANVELEAVRKAAYDEGLKNGKDSNKWALESAHGQEQELKAAVRRFEEASGIAIESWRGPEIGAAVRRVLAGDNGGSASISNARRAAVQFLDATHDLASPQDIPHRYDRRATPMADALEELIEPTPAEAPQPQSPPTFEQMMAKVERNSPTTDGEPLTLPEILMDGQT